MKSVVAAELAAIAAWRVLDQGDRVGALVFDDETSTEIRPLRSRGNVMQILGEVVKRNHALNSDDARPGNPAMLNRVLEQVCRLARHDCLVCVITDMDGADAETRRIATRLARHNDVIVGLVYDPLEHELPDGGRLVFSERDGQLEVDTSSHKVREQFGAAFSARLERARRVLLQRAVPLVPISSAEDPLEQIRSLLGRGRSGRRQ